MKVRSDYVTNSSSSSYVIAYKMLPEIDEDTLKKYPFLKNYGKLIEKVLFQRVTMKQLAEPYQEQKKNMINIL